MNWLIKTFQADRYLASLGATPEIVEWIMSQPDSQYYINQFRQHPRLDVNELSRFQSSKHKISTPTQRELQRLFAYSNDGPFHKWAVVQLRKMRIRLNLLSNGETDYDYSISMTIFDNKLRQIYDWYRMSDIDISSYTWDQAIRNSDEWHTVLAGEGSGKLYEPTDPKLIVFSPNEWKGWSIQKIVSENDLLTEGHFMNHCVASYYSQVKKGITEIYSLRDAQNKPHVTIEIDPNVNTIIQIMGNSNTEPEEKYKKYIKQWFSILKDERPGLSFEDDGFDFDVLYYVSNANIDEEINRIVYQADDYGLASSFDNMDIETLYNVVLRTLTNNNSTKYVNYIGSAIAMVAWDADKWRAKKYGLFNSSNTENSENFTHFKYESNEVGVGWLLDEIEKQNADHDYFDFNTELKLEDFESEEEYDKAIEEEYLEIEAEIRSETLPYALNDEIAKTLVKLSREDPFLPEHSKFNKESFMIINWLQKMAQGRSL